MSRGTAREKREREQSVAGFVAGFVAGAALSDPRCPATLLYLASDGLWYRKETTLVNARGWRAYMERNFPGSETELTIHPQPRHRPTAAEIEASS